MPAETHSHREGVTVDGVLTVLAAVAGIEHDDPAAVRLADIGADDTLAVLELWEAVVDDYGERSIGELPLDATELPETLGDLAELFHEHLTG